jgi:hypothetical protein
MFILGVFILSPCMMGSCSVAFGQARTCGSAYGTACRGLIGVQTAVSSVKVNKLFYYLLKAFLLVSRLSSGSGSMLCHLLIKLALPCRRHSPTARQYRHSSSIMTFCVYRFSLTNVSGSTRQPCALSDDWAASACGCAGHLPADSGATRHTYAPKWPENTRSAACDATHGQHGLAMHSMQLMPCDQNIQQHHWTPIRLLMHYPCVHTLCLLSLESR